MDKKELKMKKIAVLMGGRSSERDVSLRSGAAMLAGLKRLKYNAVGIDVGDDIVQKLIGDKTEVAVIALHGKWGEDGTMQGLLEMLRIPYSGSGVLGSAAAIDKAVSKYILKTAGVPTPSYAVIDDRKDTVSFPVPCVVKPAREGSTIGISIVTSEKEMKKAVTEAFKYDSKVVVEKFISGREITVGVVNGEVLPIVEVRPKSGFYDYTSKYTKGMTEYLVPADLPQGVIERCYENARAVWHYFELSGCARVDMIVTKGIPSVIDINTSPGMTETSLVPKAWGHLGRSFDELVEAILSEVSLKA